MGKMPAGLKRYWASRRRGKKKGGKVMVRRKGRKGSRRYGRRFAGGVRRGGNKMLRAFGVTSGGIRAGRMLAAGSLAIAPFIASRTGTDGATYSAFDYIAGKGAAGTQSVSDRVKNAAASMLYVTIGSDKLFGNSTGNITSNKALAGYGIGAGIGLTIAGKFVNPMMAGVPVKL